MSSAVGGVFRYSMMVGLIPRSWRRASAARLFEQRGLWYRVDLVFREFITVGAFLIAGGSGRERYLSKDFRFLGGRYSV
mgnify:CR=1 FL=1